MSYNLIHCSPVLRVWEKIENVLLYTNFPLILTKKLNEYGCLYKKPLIYQNLAQKYEFSIKFSQKFFPLSEEISQIHWHTVDFITNSIKIAIFFVKVKGKFGNLCKVGHFRHFRFFPKREGQENNESNCRTCPTKVGWMATLNWDRK